MSRTLRDTLGTLFGHSGARGPKGPGDTPPHTLSDTPRFRGHSRGHSGDTPGPKGPRDSCSRPAGSQTYDGKGGLSLRGVAVMTERAFLKRGDLNPGNDIRMTPGMTVR